MMGGKQTWINGIGRKAHLARRVLGAIRDLGMVRISDIKGALDWADFEEVELALLQFRREGLITLAPLPEADLTDRDVALVLHTVEGEVFHLVYLV